MTWKIQRVKGGFTISHSWWTTAPGCPEDRHPTRNCLCKIHRTLEAARSYIEEQEADQ